MNDCHEEFKNADALKRRGLILVECTGIARSGLVRKFGLTIIDWPALPERPNVDFIMRSKKSGKAMTMPLSLRLISTNREAATALYAEPGAKATVLAW